MATHSSVLAWRIPRTEEPGGLQSMGSQKVGSDGVTTRTHRHRVHSQHQDSLGHATPPTKFRLQRKDATVTTSPGRDHAGDRVIDWTSLPALGRNLLCVVSLPGTEIILDL